MLIVPQQLTWKGQGHMRPGDGVILDPFGLNSFPSCYIFLYILWLLVLFKILIEHNTEEIFDGILNVFSYTEVHSSGEWMSSHLLGKCWKSSMYCFCLFSLKKNYHERPNYVQLLEHPFIEANESKEVDVSSFVTEAIDNYGSAPKSA